MIFFDPPWLHWKKNLETLGPMIYCIPIVLSSQNTAGVIHCRIPVIIFNWDAEGTRESVPLCFEAGTPPCTTITRHLSLDMGKVAIYPGSFDPSPADTLI